jgi:hypothetical protein
VATTSGYKGISRIDQQSRKTHGWFVRVTFGGATHSKLFSDALHGGTQRALKRAIRYRNQLEKELGRPRTDRVMTTKSARSNTGIRGVCRTTKQSRPVFEVTWTPQPNTVSRTSVSIQRRGERQALLRAQQLRRQWEKTIYGEAVSV